MNERWERLLGTLRGNWILKLTALGLAFLLWSLVQAESPTRVTIPDVPVHVVNRDPDWVAIGQPAPATVNVVVTGPVRELVRLAVQRPELIVPIDQVRDSTEIHVLRTGWVVLHAGMDNTRVEDVRPSTARLSFDRITSDLLPLAIRTTGTLPAGLVLDGPIRADPAQVRASGAARQLQALDSLHLPTIDLGIIQGWDTLSVAVDTNGLDLVVTPRSVRIIVPARPVEGIDTIAAGPVSARRRPGPIGG